MRVLTICAVLSVAICAQTPNASLLQYVLQDHYHGIDYNYVRQFAATNSEWLQEALKNPAYRAHAGNIAAALGVLGQRSSASVIRTYVLSDIGKITGLEYANKKAALRALGYIVHESGDDSTLQFLRRIVAPEAWKEQKIAWLPKGFSERERDVDLSCVAAFALAVANTDVAVETLRQKREELKTASTELDVLPLRAAIEQSVIEAATIRRIGLSEYHKH